MQATMREPFLCKARRLAGGLGSTLEPDCFGLAITYFGLAITWRKEPRNGAVFREGFQLKDAYHSRGVAGGRHPTTRAVPELYRYRHTTLA